jgi:hypothetical protein
MEYEPIWALFQGFWAFIWSLDPDPDPDPRQGEKSDPTFYLRFSSGK